METPDITERLNSPSVPIRLLFSCHEEVIDELRERGPNLEPVVCVTFRKTADASGVPLAHLTLLATHLRLVHHGTGPALVVVIVRFSEHLGATWTDSTDQESRRCQGRGQLSFASGLFDPFGPVLAGTRRAVPAAGPAWARKEDA